MLISFKCRFNVLITVNYYRVDLKEAFTGYDIKIYIAFNHEIIILYPEKTVINDYTRSLTRHLFFDNLNNLKTEDSNREIP